MEGSTMKNKKILLAAGVLGVFGFVSGCTTLVTPNPLPEDMPGKVEEKVPYRGEVGIFRDKLVPVRVFVKAGDPAAAVLKKKMGEIYAPAGNAESDVNVSLRTKIDVVTPAPQCRLKAEMTVKSDIVSTWKNTAVTGNAYSTKALAAAQLQKAIALGLDSYVENVFSRALKNYQSTLLRFHSVSSKEKFLNVQNILSQIKGVVKIAIIEHDKAKRIVSFRVFYDKTLIPRGMKAAYVEKQKELER